MLPRRAALGGIVGPVAFIGAWAVGPTVIGREYSSVDEAISRLAAIGAGSRPLMTGGLVVFGAALPAFAVALRATVRGPAWISAAATGLATLGVAVTPLDRSAAVDRWHGVFAGIGYVTLALTPLLAARPLLAAGHRRLAVLGIAGGAVSSVALALTTTGAPRGLCQRLGLTATDLWIIATAAAIAGGRLSSADRRLLVRTGGRSPSSSAGR